MNIYEDIRCKDFPVSGVLLDGLLGTLLAGCSLGAWSLDLIKHHASLTRKPVASLRLFPLVHFETLFHKPYCLTPQRWVVQDSRRFP